MNEITNAVRNVLMNEYGLSRESVRGIAAEIVQSTLQRQIEQSGYLEKLVRAIVVEELNKSLHRPNSYTESPLKTLIASAAKDAAREHFERHVKITVEERDPARAEGSEKT